MKRLLFVLLLAIPSMMHAQNGGISFSKANNWNELVKEAKSTHKAIFIDVMATWCGPCKQMDKDVYSNSQIGHYMDSNFVSIKLQMDSTGTDNEQIAHWRTDAKTIGSKYKINAFPSFLFFDENENLIHKDLAFKSVHGFLALAKHSLDPQHNYTGLQIAFKKGKINQNQYLELMDLHHKFREDSLLNVVAKDYKIHFIDNRPPDLVLTPHIISFLDEHSSLFSFNDPIVQYLYNCQKGSDQALKSPGYAQRYIETMINRDVIMAKIWPNGKMISGIPAWNKIQTDLAKHYSHINGPKLLLRAKVRWYREKRDWDAVVKHEIKLIDLTGMDTSAIGLAMTNNLVFGTIFMHGTHQPDLEKGISYMEIVLKATPDDYMAMDTYANVLYKAGYKERAIEQEQMALSKAREKGNLKSMKLYQETIDKMNNSQPTW